MAHPRLESHRSPYRARANTVRSQLAEAERCELARRDLTADQRRRNLRHLRSQAEAALSRLREEYLAGIRGALWGIVKPLYRLPPKTLADVSFRDALDRAAACETQDQALTLMDRALLFGDGVQVLALAYTAAPDPTQGMARWPAVIARWKASDAAVREALDSFDEAWAEAQDETVKFEDSTMFRLPRQQDPDREADRLPTLAPTPPARHGSPTA